MTTPAEVITAARALIGSPYVLQGRAPGVGIDCIGVPVVIGQQLGLGIGDHRAYGAEPCGGQFEQLIADRLDAATAAAPGCVLLFRSLSSKQAQHCAVLTDSGTIIHAWQKMGGVVENGYRGFWPKLLLAAYCFPGIEYPAGVRRGETRVVNLSDGADDE